MKKGEVKIIQIVLDRYYGISLIGLGDDGRLYKWKQCDEWYLLTNL